MAPKKSKGAAEDLVQDDEPPSIDPYEVLSIERTASPDQIKLAYRKAALRHHPDKVSPSQRDEAKSKFQSIAFAYAVLSDPTRRKRYDETGSTSESIVDSDDFDWSDYYRAQYQDAISEEAIAQFAAKYKESQEERDDVLAAYEEGEGDMDYVYETVMLSDVLEDDDRFRRIIDGAIAEGEVEGYAKYTKETKRSKQTRVKAARGEAREADELAKELGVYEKLRGGSSSSKGGGGKKKGGGGDEMDLAALILRNQEKRKSAFEQLVEKYGGGGSSASGGKAKAGKKRGRKEALDEDIPDDEFAAIQAEMLKKAKKR
ncbi:hypothetical protein B0H66DRAFT_288049 [Apodospora peruviana]|uniref:J domain-containing protein n=1 Tax=Apodospora peruviana TaxID=516989 RepID=A0AAE0I0H7_9PEZI|nr:hypothetical protein B0H66DRAFT_288049 [Apodospora peruviana]